MATTIDVGRSAQINFKSDRNMSFTVSYDISRSDTAPVDLTSKTVKMEICDNDFEEILWSASSDTNEITIDVDNLTFDKVIDLEIGSYPYQCYIDDEKEAINHGYITIN
jgi:hypothetical protein